MGNADGSHRALRFLSSPMAGDADGENHGRTQKNGIPVSGRSERFPTETRSSTMNDCKTVRKRLTEGRAGCPSQLWPAARSAERARTCCPGRSTQGLSARNGLRGDDCHVPGTASNVLLRIGRKFTGGGSRTLAVLVSGQLEPGRETGLGFGSRGTDCLPRRWSRY